MTEDRDLQIMRCIDKKDRIGLEGVKLLLTVGRKDESGAFTKGVGLTESQADIILYAIEVVKPPEGVDQNEYTMMRLTRLFFIMSLPDKEIQILSRALEKIG